MLAHFKQIALAAICAACGFASGLTSRPRPLPLARPCPASTPCPAPTALAPLTRGVPAPCPVPIAPTPPASVTSPALAAPIPPSRPDTVIPLYDTPLSAFRFVGIGPFGGLRLARVRPGTLPAALGLQTGDELLTINDFRMSDPEQALTAYARLRHAERLNLVIARKGQKTAIVYFVR